jgi:hypothetical protein
VKNRAARLMARWLLIEGRAPYWSGTEPMEGDEWVEGWAPFRFMLRRAQLSGGRIVRARDYEGLW